MCEQSGDRVANPRWDGHDPAYNDCVIQVPIHRKSEGAFLMMFFNGQVRE